MQETYSQAWLLDFGLVHVSSAATACAEKIRIYYFYDGSEQFMPILSKEATFFSRSRGIYEGLLITWSSWPGRGAEKEKGISVQPAVNPASSSCCLQPSTCPLPRPLSSPSFPPSVLGEWAPRQMNLDSCKNLLPNVILTF